MTGVLTEFDLFAPDVIDDPYPSYARIRRSGGIARNPDLEYWALGSYDLVAAAARDHRRLSSAQGVTFQRLGLPMMLSMDPPDHERLRRLASRDFTPRAVQRWRPMIEGLVDEMTGQLVDGGSGEAITSLAAPLPIAVIANVLGVPASDWEDFKRWSDDVVEGFNLVGGATPQEGLLTKVLGAVQSLRGYFDELLPVRRERPGDDLLSKLLVPLEGDVLNDEELFWFFFLLLVAGNETTTSLLGNMLLAFCEHPDQWDRVRDDPSLVPRAVDEALRYDAPIQGFFREAVEEYRAGPHTIPAGSRVLLLYGSANRDEQHYDRADVFDVTRDAADHVAFSSGIHFCLGANLARMEAELALAGLIRRAGSIELDGDPVRNGNPTTRGLAKLPLRFRRHGN